MAIQAKAIKQKMKSIGSIKKITKTMEMISVSKMRKAVQGSIASREYARYALELLINLAKERNVSHPLLKEGFGEKIVVVIIASNKGLCGAYNMNISKSVEKLSNLEKKYGEFIICQCGNRAKFLIEYHETYALTLKNQIKQGHPVFYDCRKCQHQRFKDTPEATFRLSPLL